MFPFCSETSEEISMARIDRAEHPQILHQVDVERRKVSDVAAEYGCTTANIYALLNKLRRSAVPAAVVPPPAAPNRSTPIPAASADLPTVTPVPLPPAEAAGTSSDLFAAPPAPREPIPPPPPVATPAAVPAAVPVLPAVGPRSSRPGIGLAMRTADGDETTAPFRSLDDLLSAIKPILRDAARSPDPVWFSIRPIDLAEHDDP
jgi:hypothetical protein